MVKSCFLGQKEIQFRPSRWLSEVLAHKKISRRELLKKASQRRISYEQRSHLQGLKLQFVSGRQKAADYVKILNDLSHTQEGHHL